MAEDFIKAQDSNPKSGVSIKVRVTQISGGASPVGRVSETAGCVSPIGWTTPPDITLIDEALNEYEVVWAAAGHPHGVYPTTFSELIKTTGAIPSKVSDI